jgi:hypothetical protein
MKPEQANRLREEFPPSAIGHLPKGGVMLAYVGHAATTDRLLQVDPEWSWEPFSLTEQGLPALDSEGNLWIRLTVCGVTRPGVGDGKNAKERIGDAIRNAAMRFGVALDLWAKEDLQGSGAAASDPSSPVGEPAPDVPEASDPPPASDDAAPAGASASLKPTPGQRKKLGVLVGTLRNGANAITTENLWAALANSRKVDVETMIELLGGRDDEGALHWGPLLADLTRVEASDLIDRLDKLEEDVAGAAA